MGTRTAAEPTAEEMRGHVTEFVTGLTAGRAGHRLPLDYSVNSLRIVDAVIGGMRRRGTEPGQVTEALFGLGGYVGEVMVRHAGAVWVDFDAAQRERFGQPVGVRMPDGRVWNPPGRVVNRFAYGPQESVRTFFLLLHGRARSGEADGSTA
ncbi:hypothetical protein [Streptomyces sp. DH37]|uniref:hypothetical protein n=1 Tax=Streptomyces sp. DH37 TaxID=3040122 RepID=UPI00244295F6|nr:hypothetical protein [Streptomyces sp. DH37]MDG9701791.1 hypothetical protein [Streptomyces sp. DH37]